MSVQLHLGDCLEILKTLEDASVDAIVTDPPYGLRFMSRKWDYDVPGEAVWRECLRVLKPGSILLSFGGTRTYHRMVCPIEDAGFFIEDSLQWIYGSGFPKHKSKLKPAHEPIVLARKPGGAKWLNVDGCRVEGGERRAIDATANIIKGEGRFGNMGGSRAAGTTAAGRWPANLLLQHSPDCNGTCTEDCPIRLMGEQSGILHAGRYPKRAAKGIYKFGGQNTRPYHTDTPEETGTYREMDSGTAARFFPNFDADPDPFLYCPKASRKDRGEGNKHPTVKPTKLCGWLVRLSTPPGGIVLDPFMGSGSIGVAAIREGMGFVGIENDPESFDTARRRIATVHPSLTLY